MAAEFSFPPGREPRRGAELRLGVAGALDLRWATADLTEAAEEARRRHDLSPIAASALGRALCGSVLLQALSTRACRRVTLTIAGDGPIGRVVAEATEAGDLRGRVDQPHVDLPADPDGRLPIGRAVGSGLLRVRRELADDSSSESHVALHTGEIGLDLAHYLEQSEQTQSAVVIGVLLGPEGVRAAGGLAIEALPGANEGAIRLVEENLEKIGSVSRLLASDGVAGLEARALAALQTEIRERSELRYRCSCTRTTLAERLAVLGSEERATLSEHDGTIVAQCAFCGTLYVFEPSELATPAANRPD